MPARYLPELRRNDLASADAHLGLEIRFRRCGTPAARSCGRGFFALACRRGRPARVWPTPM
ncbi:MAG: hypothetical protein U0Z44_15960 [Kouleothrix sp.]